MPDTAPDDGSEREIRAVQEAGGHCAFGAAFFAAHLGALVRERCPDPREGLPSVQLHLHDGEQLDLCHVIGFAPLWAALAVRDVGTHGMRTELVPYESIVRITIGAPGQPGKGIGFDQSLAPRALPGMTMTPEQALRAAGAHNEEP